MHDESLVTAIAEAAESAFKELFTTHPGVYYLCALVTTGEATTPAISAWSYEALASELSRTKASEVEIKWSLADSPFFAFANEHFSHVSDLFKNRRVNPSSGSDAWNAEFDIRLDSMVEAMHRLDRNGLFGCGKEREAVVILVDTLPPDESSAARAKQLNPESALGRWLAEAAE